MTGDMVGHHIDPHRDEFTEDRWESFKETVTITANLMNKNFPNTMILSTIGNNDGEYHSSAPDEDFKSTYY